MYLLYYCNLGLLHYFVGFLRHHQLHSIITVLGRPFSETWIIHASALELYLIPNSTIANRRENGAGVISKWKTVIEFCFGNIGRNMNVTEISFLED